MELWRFFKVFAYETEPAYLPALYMLCVCLNALVTRCADREKFQLR